MIGIIDYGSGNVQAIATIYKNLNIEYQVLKEELEVGDEVLMGKYRNKRAIIKDFGKDKNNQPTIKTTKGERSMYSFRVAKFMEGPSATEKYQDFFKKKMAESGFTSIKKMSGKEKRSFFSQLSKEWKEEKERQKKAKE